MADRDGPRFDPLGRRKVYVEIASELAAKIEDGTFPPDSRLPTIADLVHEYGAARETVRKAIARLADLGMVEVVAGKGTYVLGPDQRRPRKA